MNRSFAIAPPGRDEYDDYYDTYVRKVDLRQPVLRLLDDQRSQTEQLLADLDDHAAGYRYADDKWSIKQVIGHIIDTERVFAFRGLAFARGEEQALPGMDQDAWAFAGCFDDTPIDDLASEYATVRKATISQYNSLSDQQLDRRGTASGCRFSCRATLFIIAGHERHHLGVLRDLYGLRHRPSR